MASKIPSRMGRNFAAVPCRYPHLVSIRTDHNEFFEGYSIPRYQEVMWVFKDLDLVEHLGSSIPRILETYGKDCFRFTENFTRMTFPNAWDLSEQSTFPSGLKKILVYEYL